MLDIDPLLKKNSLFCSLALVISKSDILNSFVQELREYLAYFSKRTLRENEDLCFEIIHDKIKTTLEDQVKSVRLYSKTGLIEIETDIPLTSVILSDPNETEDDDYYIQEMFNTSEGYIYLLDEDIKSYTENNNVSVYLGDSFNICVGITPSIDDIKIDEEELFKLSIEKITQALYDDDEFKEWFIDALCEYDPYEVVDEIDNQIELIDEYTLHLCTYISSALSNLVTQIRNWLNGLNLEKV